MNSKPQLVTVRAPFDPASDTPDTLLAYITSEYGGWADISIEALELDYVPQDPVKPQLLVVTFRFDPASESLDPLSSFVHDTYGGWPNLSVETTIYVDPSTVDFSLLGAAMRNSTAC